MDGRVWGSFTLLRGGGRLPVRGWISSRTIIADLPTEWAMQETRLTTSERDANSMNEWTRHQMQQRKQLSNRYLRKCYKIVARRSDSRTLETNRGKKQQQR